MHHSFPRRRPAALALGTVALLVALVAAGGALRFAHIDWDQHQQVHPDERFIVWVAATMHWPGSLAAALDPARSALNPFRWPADAEASLAGQPRNYAYGHFPLYLLVGIAHAVQAVARWMGETTLVFPAFLQPFQVLGRQMADYNNLALAGRAISAVADLGTLLWVYALARQIGRPRAGADGAAPFGSAEARGGAAGTSTPEAAGTPARQPADGRAGEIAGLLAAAAYAFAVLPIQLSHFATVDAVLTFCVTATVALAARWAAAARGGWASWLAAGACAGLAVGSKFSAILLAAPLLAAALYRLPAGSAWRKARSAIGRLAAAAAVAAAVFAVTNPFALIEFPAYVRQIVAQNAMVSGVMDAPYTRQYIGTLPYLYFVQQLSQWGLGWPLGLVCWGGLGWAVVQAGRRRAGPALIVMLAWALPYFAVTGIFHTKFLRYTAPLLPFLMVCGSQAALAGRRWLAARWGARGRVAWAGLAAAALAVTVGWALTFTGVYGQAHPWIQASRWVYEQIPAGRKLLTEHWDDALPLDLSALPNRPVPRTYERVELPLWDPDTPEKLETLVAELSTADYIVLSSNRLYAPMQRLRERYPMASQYYRLLFDGGLGYQLVREFTAYPRALGVTVRDDAADESFTVYDHPRVLVFENTARLKPELLRARLGRYLAPEATERTGLEVSAGFSGPRAQPAEASSPEGYLNSGRLRPTTPGRAPGLARPRPQAPAPDAPLTLAQPVDALPVVADFRWNRLASASAPAAVGLWWLVSSLFGWLAWPLLFPLLGGLRDRGYGLARAAGWLLVGWAHWLGVSLGLWQNRLGAIAALTGALAAAGLAAGWAQRGRLTTFWAERRRLLLGEEAVFAGAFLAFVGVRLLNPDLWQPWNGGEKFMEFAFLNAILRSPSFPPYDPYFAGGILNYYYFGLYLVTLPIKLTGITSDVAFNLAVPGLFALTAVGVFSVAFTLAGGEGSREGGEEGPLRGRRWAGAGGALVAVAMALLMGNLSGFNWLVQSLGQWVRGSAAPGFDYWGASRVIPATINEFPLWTFTFADLHPHLIAMPFGMLVVGLALGWVRRGEGEEEGEQDSRVFVCLARLAFLAGALGALGAINTWDLPTYALLVVGAFVLAGWRSRRRWAFATVPLAAGATLALAVAAYLPFYAYYQAQVGGQTGPLLARYLGWVRASSPLKPWLSIWGLFLFLALSYVLAELWPGGRRAAPADPAGLPADRKRLIAGLALVGVLTLLAGMGRPTAALTALPLCLALPLVLRRCAPAEDAFAAWLLVMGLAIVAGTELVYLRDFLEGGDWYRMNTLFKFSVPAWLLLSLGSGMALAKLWPRARRAAAWAGLPWQAATAALLAVSFIFLAVGVRTRVDDRFPGARPALGTLDATAYMTVGRYTWPSSGSVIELAGEREAIRWLLEHVSGSPVIAEAPAGSYEVQGATVGYDYYRAGGLRVASLTGFPTFVGPHQYEQRPGDQVGPRTDLGQEFFRTTDIARARELVRDLRVGYVYLGRLERILFNEESLRKFEVMAELGDLEVAFRSEQVTIYHVVP